MSCREPKLKYYKKYNGYSVNSAGRYTSKSFPALENMPRRFIRAAVNAANNSLSTGTWRVYKSGTNEYLDLGLDLQVLKCLDLGLNQVFK